MPNSVHSVRSQMSNDQCADNDFCVFLNVVEGCGFNLKESVGDCHRDKIILYATLNNIKFEIEGQSLSRESATIFNNCCIWETDMEVIKRMKTDNRPVKIECFQRPGENSLAGSKAIGALLLPIRGLTPVTTLRNLQIKLHWHKLGTLSAEWRQTKPEIYLLLLIVKKNLIESGQLDALLGKGKKQGSSNLLSARDSETSFMLQSQSNVYVQLLEHIGAIQIGNNPDIDCDIFNVSLIFKQVRNIDKLLELEFNSDTRNANVFVFHYDILGKPSHLEILINRFDCYAINDKITLSFRTSQRSLRCYFQRIFYLPINLYYNGIAIASYRMDFSKLMPDDQYFDLNKVYSKNGTSFFDRLHKALSPRTPKPSVGYTFTMQQMTFNGKKNQETKDVCETLVPPYKSSDIPEINMERLIQCNENRTADVQKAISSEQFAKSMDESVPMQGRNSDPQLCRTNAECTENRGEQQEHAQITTDKQLAMPTTETAAKSSETLTATADASTTTAPGHNHASSTDADKEAILYNIVKELEAWKVQEMDNFYNALKQKEHFYFADLQQRWNQERAVLRARLEAKIANCEELSARLEKAHAELQINAIKSQENVNLAEKVKRDIESTYTNKFQVLEQQIEHLKVEVQQKETAFEIKTKEIHFENQKLQKEKSDLENRILGMEKLMSELCNEQKDKEHLKQVMEDMRQQSEHYHAAEKEKNFYKKKWTKTTREIQKLKLTLLEKQQLEARKNEKDDEFDCAKCLEEILGEEKDEFNTDRSELQGIKEVLFASSESESDWTKI